MVAAFTFFLGKDEVNKEEEGEVDDDSDQEVQVLIKNIVLNFLICLAEEDLGEQEGRVEGYPILRCNEIHDTLYKTSQSVP